MANLAHLVRRQSSMDLHAGQRSMDRVEMKEMRGRLVRQATGNTVNYGTANAAFEDASPNTQASVTMVRVNLVEDRTQMIDSVNLGYGKRNGGGH
jgi:hypothetical protein